MTPRRLLLTAIVALVVVQADVGWADTAPPLDPASSEGAALVARLRRGGLVMFLRHADTAGEPCDRSFRIGDRPGQRNISPVGRRQATEIGARLAALGIPVGLPVLAFGAGQVSVTDGLLADDYAEGRLGWVLDEHQRLFAAPVPDGVNRVLVGHRGPVQMILGDPVRGTRLPEGGVVVLEPLGAAGFTVLGILAIVPPIEGGNPSCQ